MHTAATRVGGSGDGPSAGTTTEILDDDDVAINKWVIYA
jgi:hypothetical protein